MTTREREELGAEDLRVANEDMVWGDSANSRPSTARTRECVVCGEPTYVRCFTIRPVCPGCRIL